MNHDPIATRSFLVARSNDDQFDQYVAGVSAPYHPAEVGPAGYWGCRAIYGENSDPISHEILGADAIEALENAVRFVEFFVESLAQKNLVKTSDGGGYGDTFPSEYSRQFRKDLGMVLRGDS